MLTIIFSYIILRSLIDWGNDYALLPVLGHNHFRRVSVKLIWHDEYCS